MDNAVFKAFLIQEQSGKKRKRSLQTVLLHLSLLKRLARAVPDLSPKKVEQHLFALYEQGRKGNYLNSYVDLLHMYGRFKKTTKYEVLKYFPEEEFEKATMSDEEIEAFLSLPCPTITRRDTRPGSNRMLTYPIGQKRWVVKTLFWKILAYSGMRPGEVAHLTVDTVDFGRQVFLANGKTGKRMVPIAPHLLQELTQYVGQLKTKDLFPAQRTTNGRQGGYINDVAWGYDFHQRLKRLGIKRKNLTPYSLRHSFITRMLDEGVNLYPLQNLIGHKQGSPVTSTYYHMTTKTLFKTLSRDTLGRARMPYEKRFEQFRQIVRQALSDLAKSPTEEKKMLKDLGRTVL